MPTSQANGKRKTRTIGNVHTGSVVIAQNHAIPRVNSIPAASTILRSEPGAGFRAQDGAFS